MLNATRLPVAYSRQDKPEETDCLNPVWSAMFSARSVFIYIDVCTTCVRYSRFNPSATEFKAYTILCNDAFLIIFIL